MNRILLYLFVCSVVVLASITAEAGVRVEDDEVVFTLGAPGAVQVFLVGDFNNWNPTLEKMEKEGDLFTIRLYLLPGSYRYKFVVDGQWIVDPENPPTDRGRGSSLVLEERTGMLALGAEEPVVEGGAPSLEPSMRYTGAFSLDGGETSSDQTLDFYFTYEGKGVRSNVDFKTVGESWDLSPLEADIRFDRGFVETMLGDSRLRAFENDTIWSSSDPFELIGNIGIYGYDAGYERKGFAFESSEILNTRVRAMYGDKLDRRLRSPVIIPAGAFGGFPMSTTPDTVVYRFDRSAEDEDTWGIEFAADAGSLDFGYAQRNNRGLHPGLLADVSRGSGSFAVSSFNTREQWKAGVLWLRWRRNDDIMLGGGYGYSNAEIRKTVRSVDSVATLSDVATRQDANRFDGQVPLHSSTRWHGALVYNGGLFARVTYEWNEFEFDRFVYSKSRARMRVVRLDVSRKSLKWRMSGSVGYTDQDYGETPTDFHFFTPGRNYWLDWGDRLDAGGMVAFDLARNSDLLLSFFWDPREENESGASREVVPFRFDITAGAVGFDFFERIELLTARLNGEYGLGERFYLALAARIARYDKPSWSLDKTYFASYLEAGFRNRRVEVSLGAGLDPMILDPITNNYRDNGWEEALRKRVPADLDRDQAVVLGQGLQESESDLRDSHVIKLEVVLYF